MMDRAASATDVSSGVPGAMREEESYSVTEHGVPIDGLAEARRRLLDRLAAQPVRNIGTWTRDSLYERWKWELGSEGTQ
jgi:hypothetical protein